MTGQFAVGDFAERTRLVRIVLGLSRNSILTASVELIILNLVFLAAVFGSLHLLNRIIRLAPSCFLLNLLVILFLVVINHVPEQRGILVASEKIRFGDLSYLGF